MIPPFAKILVVDDLSTIRKVIRRILTDMGLNNIVEAVDGQQAFDPADAAARKGSPFDIIISDWNMPVKTGIQFLREVRASELLRNTPFVLVTAENEKDNVLEAISKGVSSWIAKPFTADLFKARLSDAWTKHGSTRTQ